MARGLTVKAIENFKPGAKRYEVPDGEVRGLYLQVFPSGKSSWCFRVGGRSRKLTIGPSPEIGLAVARGHARKAHGELADGKDPGAAKQVRKSAERKAKHETAGLVEKVAEVFSARHVKNLKPSTQAEVKRVISS